MLESEIYEKEKKYLRFINILIILNIFMVIVVVLIYLNTSKPSTLTGRKAVGQMPSNMRILPVESVEEAKERMLEYIEMIGLSGLALKRVIAFNKYFYVYVKEQDTDRTAFCLKIIKLGTFSFKKFPSVYPQMMWNDKYGHSAKRELELISNMTVGLGTAKGIAKDVVSKLGSSYTLTKNPDTYYGFYEFIVFQNKTAVGEISINGKSGKVVFKMYPSTPIELTEFI